MPTPIGFILERTIQTEDTQFLKIESLEQGRGRWYGNQHMATLFASADEARKTADRMGLRPPRVEVCPVFEGDVADRDRPRLWRPGHRVLYAGYPATLLAPVYDGWAWILCDLDRDASHPPRTVPVDNLSPLR